MNEWDRLHRMAEYYKAEYPSGTRIMLLSMGEDMHRVEDNTRGTVLTVDDIGTLHCKFDNGTMSRGRSLTARILESSSQERGCILSDILETDVPAKYFLSETQMERLLCKSYQGRRDVGSTPPAESPSP